MGSGGAIAGDVGPGTAALARGVGAVAIALGEGRAVGRGEGNATGAADTVDVGAGVGTALGVAATRGGGVSATTGPCALADGVGEGGN